MVVTIDGIPVFQALVNDADTGMFKISLVDDPAVQSNFQAFANKKPVMYAVEDESKRLVLGVVMRADFPIYRRDDSMGEYYVVYSADTIRTMAEKYLVEGRQNDVNLMHAEGSDVSGVDMVQYFIKDTEKGIIPAGFDDIADGSLFAEFHIVNDEVWDAVLDGTYKGFSLEGVFDLVPEQNVDKVQDIVDTLNGLFSRIFKPKKYEKMTKVKGLLARLARALVEMGNVTTDKGILSWDGEEDLKAGDAVYIEDQDGNRTPAADGDYTTGDGKVIIVVDGKVSEIKDSAAEVAPQQTAAEPAAKMVQTDKGKLEWDNEDEDLKAGDAVYITDEEGNRAPAPDGDYTTEDGKVISVVDGKVASITDPKAEVDSTRVEKLHRIAQAFSESYDTKRKKIYEAIHALGYDQYGWLADCGDDFAVYETYDDNYDPHYTRFAISWDADGNAVASNPVEVVPAFVTKEERDAADENFQAVVREKETLSTEKADLESRVSDLTAQVEALKAAPQGQPAHEEFNSGAATATGNKKIDNLSRIMSAK